MKQKSKEEIHAMSFEQAMHDLEQIIAELEKGDIPLEDSIAAYEYGSLLKKHAEYKLNNAKERIDKISIDDDHGVVLEDVPELKEGHGRNI